MASFLRPRAYTVMAHIVMAYIVMACVAMAYIVMVYAVMAYIVMAHLSLSGPGWTRTTPCQGTPHGPVTLRAPHRATRCHCPMLACFFPAAHTHPSYARHDGHVRTHTTRDTQDRGGGMPRPRTHRARARARARHGRIARRGAARRGAARDIRHARTLARTHAWHAMHGIHYSRCERWTRIAITIIVMATTI